VRNLFLMCGCRFRFLDRNLLSGDPLLYLEDLNPLTISCIDSLLSLRSADNERQDETTKRGNDTTPYGANTPHRGVSIVEYPQN
jgi:hypothetical protein